MRKIVGGRRFDTETATALGTADNVGAGADSTTDHHWWEATLYRSPRGKHWFLAGRGGPMSRFGQATGVNSWTGGADLIPLTEGEALEWAERWLSVGEVEAAFVDRITDA